MLSKINIYNAFKKAPIFFSIVDISYFKIIILFSFVSLGKSFVLPSNKPVHIYLSHVTNQMFSSLKLKHVSNR